MDLKLNNDKEELKNTIQSLCSQTRNRAAVWECVEYFPAAFHLGDEYGEGEEKKNYIVHVASFEYTAQGVRYAFGITEDITMGKGNAGCTGIRFYVYETNGETLCGMDEVIDAADEDEYGFLPLCDAVYERAGEWLKDDFFEYMDERYFYPMIGTTAKHKRQPLCRLMEKLMNERRAGDFHKMVMDMEYRNKLLNELTESHG